MIDRDRIDAALAARLVAEQFPQWAHLPVTRIEPGGWDNRTFRLGDELTVRMPTAAGYVPAVEKERTWLPRLAPLLPLPIPEPVGVGEPGDGYPFPWTVNRWLPGETLLGAPPVDLVRLGEDVGRFLSALHGLDPSDGPAAGAHSFERGRHPSVYAEDVDRSRRSLAGRLDDAVGAVWDDGLATRWEHDGVWFHGDIAPGNLLVVDGRLSAVIDFGTSGVGDPACDAALAWTWLDAPGRRSFREAAGFDDGTWARGRAWALWKALLLLDGGDAEARAGATRTLEALFADHRARRLRA